MLQLQRKIGDRGISGAALCSFTLIFTAQTFSRGKPSTPVISSVCGFFLLTVPNNSILGIVIF